MGFSIKDLNNAVNHLQSALEENSQRKGRELAERIMGKNRSRSNRTEESDADNQQQRGNWGSDTWGSNGW